MSAAGAAAAAAMKAVLATGGIVRVSGRDFLKLLNRQKQPLVVVAPSRILFFETGWRYLTSYRGLVFFARSSTPLDLPEDAELVEAKRIWIP
jgi:hypothetical protein